MASEAPSTRDLVDHVLSYVHDPLGYVYFAFPWGEPGTLLEGESGPDAWQVDVLEEIRAHLEASPGALRQAIASGHGIGKSTLVAWLILWMMSTRPHPQIKVTAGTGQQLEHHTWRELAKWNNLAINGDWFTWTATKFYLSEHPETWFAAAIPWRKEKAQAFAGMHEDYVATIYDEASVVDDTIWEVSEGAMSTPGAIHWAFGNPEKAQGRFRDCFPGGRFAHRWKSRQIDSRTAKKTDKDEIARQIADYGEDSDFVRVRWRGLFPRGSSIQLIGDDAIECATSRTIEDVSYAAVVLGVDVARFGDDRSVIYIRQGGKILAKHVYREIDTMQLASFVLEAIREHSPQAVFIDVVGIGAGVVDRLHQLGHQRLVIGVNVGERAVDAKKYANKRAEIWDTMRLWLFEVGEIAASELTLIEELKAPQYGYDIHERLKLESKDQMRARNIPSPDEADALALTFTMPVAKKDTSVRPTQRRQPMPSGYGWMR